MLVRILTRCSLVGGYSRLEWVYFHHVENRSEIFVTNQHVTSSVAESTR